MEIKTKYEFGDKVYFLNDGEVLYGFVISISIFTISIPLYPLHPPHIKYSIVSDCKANELEAADWIYDVKEQKCFRSRQELAESILASCDE